MSPAPSLSGRRVLITGAARGIGAALAERLHQRGARVALAGLEPDLLAEVARSCGDAPWWTCDVTDREQVEAAVDGAVEALWVGWTSPWPTPASPPSSPSSAATPR